MNTHTGYHSVIQRLNAAATPTPKLVTVSKQQSWDKITPVLDAGHRIFGENRVQEAVERWGDKRDQYPDLQLHLIGPLQTNKTDDAVQFFDVIETLDRPKLAHALAKAMDKTGKWPDVYIQVNTGAEAQKSGVSPADLPDLLDLAHDLNLPIIGLMCIPPVDEPAAPHFVLLRNLAHQYALPHVSMGMSNDFELATKLGATSVRVGSAVFGERG